MSGAFQATNFDCEVKVTSSKLDAAQLSAFASSQMPRTGVGEVPWSTPLTADELATLAESGKAEFLTARLIVTADGLAELPLVGIGALIREVELYPFARMIIVVDQSARREGLGSRIAQELIERLLPGEIVQAQVQNGSRANKFFEDLGFKCVDPDHRTGRIPEYLDGQKVGVVSRTFALYQYRRDTDTTALPGNFRDVQ